MNLQKPRKTSLSHFIGGHGIDEIAEWTTENIAEFTEKIDINIVSTEIDKKNKIITGILDNTEKVLIDYTVQRTPKRRLGHIIHQCMTHSIHTAIILSPSSNLFFLQTIRWLTRMTDDKLTFYLFKIEIYRFPDRDTYFLIPTLVNKPLSPLPEGLKERGELPKKGSRKARIYRAFEEHGNMTLKQLATRVILVDEDDKNISQLRTYVYRLRNEQLLEKKGKHGREHIYGIIKKKKTEQKQATQTGRRTNSDIPKDQMSDEAIEDIKITKRLLYRFHEQGEEITTTKIIKEFNNHNIPSIRGFQALNALEMMGTIKQDGQIITLLNNA